MSFRNRRFPPCCPSRVRANECWTGRGHSPNPLFTHFPFRQFQLSGVLRHPFYHCYFSLCSLRQLPVSPSFALSYTSLAPTTRAPPSIPTTLPLLSSNLSTLDLNPAHSSSSRDKRSSLWHPASSESSVKLKEAPLHRLSLRSRPPIFASPPGTRGHPAQPSITRPVEWSTLDPSPPPTSL